MGYISLPSLDDIVQMKDPKRQTEALLNTVGILIKNLSELNGYITTTNVKELNAEKLVAGSITAEKIGANEITADKMDVSELSAITANLGTITAGLMQAVTIIGSLIQTQAAGSYPRIELSATENMLKAESDAANKIRIFGSSTSEPTIRLTSSTGFSDINQIGQELSLTTFWDILLQTNTGSINLVAPGGVYVNGVPI